MFIRKGILVLFALILTVWPGIAQEDTSLQTVETFYQWYLDNLGYDEETDTFRNPIVDGSFRERPELSPEFIAVIDEQEERAEDPFLCAQDVPERAVFSAVDEQSVLVEMYFGFNPHPHTVLVVLDGDGLIAAVNCRESVTERGTVETFYMTYILNRDAAQIGDNPLLTDALNEQLADTLANPIPLGEGDPVVCAQDRPTYVQADRVTGDENAATMLVRTFFANNPTPSLLAVGLVWNDRWQLDTILCDVPPETVAAYVYNEFITYRRYDLENGLERIPLDNWARYPWDTLLTPELYDRLMAVYLGDDPMMADPFLCAQDLPETINATPDGDDVIVSGLYPSGEDTYTAYDLARLTMTQTDSGLWQIADITCLP